MTVNVTQDDLDKGATNDCQLCPVALALQRVIKKEFHTALYVAQNWFFIYRGVNDPLEIDFPVGVAPKIMLIDLKQKVEPFSFDIEIPEEYLEKRDAP